MRPTFSDDNTVVLQEDARGFWRVIERNSKTFLKDIDSDWYVGRINETNDLGAVSDDSALPLRLPVGTGPIAADDGTDQFWSNFGSQVTLSERDRFRVFAGRIIETSLDVALNFLTIKQVRDEFLRNPGRFLVFLVKGSSRFGWLSRDHFGAFFVAGWTIIAMDAPLEALWSSYSWVLDDFSGHVALQEWNSDGWKVFVSTVASRRFLEVLKVKGLEETQRASSATTERYLFVRGSTGRIVTSRNRRGRHISSFSWPSYFEYERSHHGSRNSPVGVSAEDSLTLSWKL